MTPARYERAEDPQARWYSMSRKATREPKESVNAPNLVKRPLSVRDLLIQGLPSTFIRGNVITLSSPPRWTGMNAKNAKATEDGRMG
jgi:hypothetical protein